MQASLVVPISDAIVFLTDFEKLNFDIVVLFYARLILCHYQDMLKIVTPAENEKFISLLIQRLCPNP
jgi:hypothetical protein